MLAQQTQHPVLTGPNSLMAEPGPDFAITLADKDGRGQQLPNGIDQLLV